MSKLVRSAVYFAVIGFLSFLVGRILPKKWFDWEAPWFKCLPWENDGKIYDRLHIRKWKDLLPDMNKITPVLMKGRAPKTAHSSVEEMEGVLQETCVAEVIHEVLCVIGFGCMSIWPGMGGFLIAVLHALGNLLFVMVQRYNRPRMRQLYLRRTKPAARTQTTKAIANCEGETV